jgi:serine/threonine protein phosphatase PrpC
MKASSFPELSAFPGQSLELGAATDAGRKRRGEPNQDSHLVLPAEGDRPPMFIVADGMGGHAGGAEASRLVVETIAAHYRRVEKISDPLALLKDCLFQAHQALIAHVKGHPTLASMGSTAVLAIVDGGQVYIANVGDSRAYLLHGREVIQLSFDHSVVGDQIRLGRLTPLEALRSPKRNRLTQSISPKRKELDPYLAQSPFGEDDTLLLCTDGLWGVVTEAIMQAVALEIPPQEAADKLVALTLASGAPDNVTVVTARRRGAKITASYDDDETNPGLEF